MNVSISSLHWHVHAWEGSDIEANFSNQFLT